MARWGCRDCHTQFGAWLSRCPRCGSPKELVVALNACTSCTTKFAVGLPKCPHCGSTEYVEDGAMAKITAHGGPSDKTLPGAVVRTEAVLTEEQIDALREAVDAGAEPLPFEATAEPAETEEGGEESSPGTSSETSSEKPENSPEPSETPSPKRARTTGSRSGKGRTGGSSARSTAGGQETGTSAADDA